MFPYNNCCIEYLFIVKKAAEGKTCKKKNGMKKKILFALR